MQFHFAEERIIVYHHPKSFYFLWLSFGFQHEQSSLPLEVEERGKNGGRMEIWNMSLTFSTCLGGEIEAYVPVISISSITDADHGSFTLPRTLRFMTASLRKDTIHTL